MSAIPAPPLKPAPRRWILGVAATLLLHAILISCILIYPRWSHLLPADAAPIAIDLAPLPAASPSPQQDTPPAPEPRPQSDPQTAPAQRPPLPLVPEVSQPTPDALTTPQTKPSATPQTRPASEAAAPPAVAAPARATEAAAQAGSQNSATSPAHMTWRAEVLAKLERYKRYPAPARFAREEDIVFVRFTIDRVGRVTSCRLVSSHGFEALDREAVDLPQRVSPLPPPPANTGDADLTLTVPISFSLHAS